MSTLALYRKYRPQRFADITGQQHITVTLGNEIITGKLAHAYLFTGPRGVGKTTIARILAKAVNCTGRGGETYEPCGTCAACVAITAGKSLDVLEIDAASNTGVDNVREHIIEHVRFRPSQLTYTVFIIDEVHMLSTSAFNALLKTLEEPPPHVLFILATTELHKVPATIVSRCQRFDFKKITVEDLKQRLAHIAVAEERRVEPQVFARVAVAAGGSLRDAESLLGQLFAVSDGVVDEAAAALVLPRSDHSAAVRFLAAIFERNAGAALQVVAATMEQGGEPLRFIDDCLAGVRSLMLAALERDPERVIGEDAETLEIMSRLAASVSLRRMTEAMELLLEKRQQLKESEAGLLPLELAAVELTFDKGSSAPPTSTLTPSAHGGTTTVSASSAPQAMPLSSPTTTPTPATIPAVTEATTPTVPEQTVAVHHSPPVDAKTTLVDVRREWQTLIRMAGEMNHALPFLLNVSTPTAVEQGTIVIGSRYPFHCDRLNAEKQHSILRVVCEKLFGEPLGVRTDLTALPAEETPGEVVALTAPVEADPALRAVMDALGGTVVG
jgi:DNA polymerase-3 subunit gamma/tau